MVTDRKLTIETLTKLGARKLAELLITEAAGNRRLKQTLNLATSTQDGPAALGAIVRRRLVTLAKSRSMLPYDKGRELIAELDGLRTTIIETIAPKDSRLAFELLWWLWEFWPLWCWRPSGNLASRGSNWHSTPSRQMTPMWEQFHTLRLGESLDPFNPAVQSFLEQARARFLQQTGDPAAAQQLAWQALENLRHQQASALACFDCFWLFAVVILAVTLVVFLMKRSVAEKGARIGGEWSKYFVRPMSVHGPSTGYLSPESSEPRRRSPAPLRLGFTTIWSPQM
jgi:hypothetical protein